MHAKHSSPPQITTEQESNSTQGDSSTNDIQLRHTASSAKDGGTIAPSESRRVEVTNLAAVMLQRIARGWAARRAVRLLTASRSDAATVIQRAYWHRRAVNKEAEERAAAVAAHEAEVEKKRRDAAAIAKAAAAEHERVVAAAEAAAAKEQEATAAADLAAKRLAAATALQEERRLAAKVAADALAQKEQQRLATTAAAEAAAIRQERAVAAATEAIAQRNKKQTAIDDVVKREIAWATGSLQNEDGTTPSTVKTQHDHVAASQIPPQRQREQEASTSKKPTPPVGFAAMHILI